MTNRVIDANLNRLREGIRVVEDIYRFVFNDKVVALKLKELRHLSRVDSAFYELLDSRDIINDTLRESIDSELKRDNLDSILISNFKRAQESSRVLEEVLKLSLVEESEKFKYIRYTLYDIEKTIIKISRKT